MRLRFVLFFTIQLQWFVCSAQEFEGGLLCGISASQIDGDDYGGYHKIGLTAGAFLKRELGDNWLTQFEMRYMQKGAAWYEGDYIITLNYIELPFLVQKKIKEKYIPELGIAPSVFVYGINASNHIKSRLEHYRKFNMDIRLGMNYQVTAHFSGSFQYLRSVLPIARYKSSYISRNEWGHSIVFLIYYKI